MLMCFNRMVLPQGIVSPRSQVFPNCAITIKGEEVYEEKKWSQGLVFLWLGFIVLFGIYRSGTPNNIHCAITKVNYRARESWYRLFQERQ